MTITLNKIGIIGAGQMGSGIAHVCALAGYDVLLNDVSADRIKSGLATINGNMARQVGSEKIGEDDRQAALDRIAPGRGLRRPRRRRPGHRGGDRGRGGQARHLRRAAARR